MLWGLFLGVIFITVLLRRPRTLPEYFESACKVGRGSCLILISYETHQSLVEPRANVSPFMNYEIWLILRASVERDSTDKNVQKEEATSKLINSNKKSK